MYESEMKFPYSKYKRHHVEINSAALALKRLKALEIDFDRF